MKTKFLLLILVLFSFSGFSQKNFWIATKKSVDNSVMPIDRVPSAYLTYAIDFNEVKEYLKNAPKLTDGVDSNILFSIPDENGNLINLKVYKSMTMSDGLAASAPGIGAYRAVGVDNNAIKASITTSIFGLQVGVYRIGEPTIIVQPISKDNQFYAVYSKDKLKPVPFHCSVDSSTNELDIPTDFSRNTFVNDGVLRKYRFAVSANGEYSTFHVNRAINAGNLPANATDAQKKDAILAAVVTTIDRLNTVYEVDFGVTLELVPTERNAIYLDSNTDPFDNTSQSQMMNANTGALNNTIGAANYDGGHIFSTYPGGGVSGLGVICGMNKGRSFTGLANPVGDQYDIDFVAHEVGHAFGGNHTFANYCGGNRHLQTAVEPGSGSTIMAYAGVCAPNVQQHSDDYFAKASIQEIGSFITSGGSCAQQINLGNHAPVITIESHSGVKVPKSTPFILNATVVDQDGDNVTLCWEEADRVDNSVNNHSPSSTDTSGPMFRSYSPTTEGWRMFPKIENILDNTYHNDWEVLPSVTRNMYFTVTARDNHPGGGQTPYGSLAFQIDGSSGPFRVTSQSTNTIWAHGTTQTITWNVAGTNAGQVNCANVDILLSTDGGQTFATQLATNVTNNGHADIVVPVVDTANGVIMVKGHNNYFFDLAKGNITIGNIQVVCNTQASNSNLGIAIPDNSNAGISTTLNYPTSETINDVNVHVNISHTYVQDLKVSVVSPQGTEIVLWNHFCGGENNLNVTFDDEGSAISCAALTGAVTPGNPLSGFAGENSQGTWTLKVSDNYTGDTGTINDWSIEICHTESDVQENIIQDLQIWPNPAQNNVNVKFNVQDTQNGVNIIVNDISGRAIISKKYDAAQTYFNQNIPLNNLSKGIYLIQINNGKYNATKKLIVE